MTKNQFRKKCIQIEKVKNKKVLFEIISSNILNIHKNIGIYFPLKNEYDILGLIEKYPNKTFAFPKTTNSEEMMFLKATETKDFKVGRHKVHEPKYNIQNIMNANDLDCIIVPCIGISNNKRVGFGAGYYDKYLENFNGTILGIVNNKCINDTVKMEPHDIIIDKIFEGE